MLSANALCITISKQTGIEGGVWVDRVWVSEVVHELGQFGLSEQGIFRPAFAEADRQARQFIVSLLQDEGLTVTQDVAGNITGRLEGSDPSAPAVATGSHLDTVPGVGEFDGAAGVIAGLAAVRRLKRLGSRRHAVEIIVFAASAASRFPLPLVGSKLMAGVGQEACLLRLQDERGVTMAEAARHAAAGWTLQPVRRRPDALKAFIELHIEQGDILAEAGVRVGIATDVAAHTRLKITVRGLPAHAGATPMEKRHDALVSAAMLIMAVEEVAVAAERHGTVCTVGMARTCGADVNTVPGLVELWVSIRGTEQQQVVYALQEIKDAASTIADGQDTPVDIAVVSVDKPVQLDGVISDLLAAKCTALGVPYRRLSSLAAHDVMHMAALAPSGLLLIPSRGGLSHNPREYSDIDDVMAGIDMLTETLASLTR